MPDDIEPTPDIEVGRYALRSFKWSVEPVDPKFKEWLDGLPPPVTVALRKPGDPVYPTHITPPVNLGERKWSEEYEPPPLAERLGWWEDCKVRVWRSPSYMKRGDWEDGTCKAVCHTYGPRGSKEPHEAPDKDCSCGIYGSLSYVDLLSQFRPEAYFIVAVIAAEGKTIIGDRGLRTAFARVVAYSIGSQIGSGRDSDSDFLHRYVAAKQFKDAKIFESPLDMVTAFNLALLPPSAPLERYRGTPQWWTKSEHS